MPAASMQSYNLSSFESDANILEQLTRWLPIQIEKQVVENTLGNLKLYPQAIPVTKEALLTCQAYQIVQLISQYSQKPLVVEDKGNAIGLLPIPETVEEYSKTVSDSLFIVIMGANPVGVFDMWESRVANRKVATLVAFEGQADKKAKSIAKVNLDFGLDEIQKISLEPNKMVSIPTKEGQKVKLNIECEKDFKINNQKKLKIEIISGSFGIIFDCRGRPLKLPEPTSEGKEKIAKWRKGLNLE